MKAHKDSAELHLIKSLLSRMKNDGVSFKADPTLIDWDFEAFRKLMHSINNGKLIASILDTDLSFGDAIELDYKTRYN